MRWLRIIRPVIYFLAGAMLLVYMSVYFIPPLLQKEPARYRIEEFASTYRGESWLRVEGQLALQHLRTAPAAGSEAARSVVIHVPMIPPDWKETDPVHVVVTFDSIRLDQLERWQQKHERRRVAVTGVTRTLGGLPYDRLFPRLLVGSPVVTIIADAEPTGIAVVLLMLGISVILMYFCGRAIYDLLRP